jgi:hypothetical protein
LKSFWGANISEYKSGLLCFPCFVIKFNLGFLQKTCNCQIQIFTVLYDVSFRLQWLTAKGTSSVQPQCEIQDCSIYSCLSNGQFRLSIFKSGVLKKSQPSLVFPIKSYRYINSTHKMAFSWREIIFLVFRSKRWHFLILFACSGYPYHNLICTNFKTND